MTLLIRRLLTYSIMSREVLGSAKTSRELQVFKVKQPENHKIPSTTCRGEFIAVLKGRIADAFEKLKSACVLPGLTTRW